MSHALHLTIALQHKQISGPTALDARREVLYTQLRRGGEQSLIFTRP